jgi:acetyl esterase/lipase
MHFDRPGFRSATRPAGPQGRRGGLLRLAHGLSLGLVLAGCSGPAVLNALTPDTGYRAERDLVYGPDDRQRLDLYLPEGAPADAPLVVFFYGGRWQEGSKASYPFVGQAFASRGYVTAIPDYRLYPQVRYAGILEDAAAAVRAAVRHLDGGAAARPVFLVGHSAGAYVALMLALDPRWLEQGRLESEMPEPAGGRPCRLADAGVGLAGPYDFLPLDSPDLQAIFAPGDASTQPIRHADADDPPVLLITGADDETVLPGNTRRLAARLRDVGGRAETRFYDGVGHVGLVAALATPLRFTAPVLDDVDAFLSRVAAAPAHGCRDATASARPAGSDRTPSR